MTHTTTRGAPRKRALAPDASTLDERSLRAWTERMAVRRLGDGRYAVDGESDATYVVDLEKGSCTCPDRQIRRERCKHLRRVAIEINLGRVPAPGSERCRGCGAELPPGTSDSPPHLCSTCELEPGEYVTDRETGDTLRVVAVSSSRADQVTIPELGTSVAAHPTNQGYPPDDPVVEVTYPESGAGTGRVYSFPLSRLRRRRTGDDDQLTLADHGEAA